MGSCFSPINDSFQWLLRCTAHTDHTFKIPFFCSPKWPYSHLHSTVLWLLLLFLFLFLPTSLSIMSPVFSINTWQQAAKFISIFLLLLPGVPSLQTGGNKQITAAIPANRPDPARPPASCMRHCRVTSSTWPAPSFLICFLNAGSLHSRWAVTCIITPCTAHFTVLPFIRG